MGSQKENNLLQMSKTKQKCEKNIYLSFEKTDEIKKYLKEEKMLQKLTKKPKIKKSKLLNVRILHMFSKHVL